MFSLQKIFKTVSTVAKKTATPTYAVGGFVRDFLMGWEQKKDIDFVVEGSGLAFAKEFDKAMKEAGSLVEFPDFDTARYILSTQGGPASGWGEGDDTLVLEFAGARGESYDVKSRKPKVKTATLADDLLRRDFTVNAMAVEAKIFAATKKPTMTAVKKALVSVDNSLADLQERLLRTPLDPDKTFSDDPLRMMRAIRFAGQLHFGIDAPALKSIHKNRERIKIISAERVQEELLKMLACPMPSVCLILLFQTGLLDIVLPEVAELDGVEEVYGHQHKNNLVHTFKVVDNIAERGGSILLRLAGLLHDIGKASTKKFLPKIGWTFYQHEHVGRKLAGQIGRRLRLSKEQTDYISKLVRWHQQPISLMDEGITDSAVRRLIVNLGDELADLLTLGASDITTGNPTKKEKRLKNYERLKKRIDEVMEKDKLRAFQSPVRGEEIMAECGLKPGPTVGRIKEALEEAILDGIIPNEYEATKKYFLKIKDKYLKEALPHERI
ncbi:MAG: HD domain-containing protein [Patescibacteria group bacterium]|nr:HD domain-containing protein [Patescibacteria group bacterium]